MARHSKRSTMTGRYAPVAVTGSKPHKTRTRMGVSDIDREMAENSHESSKWNEGRWDEEAEINASIVDGLGGKEDWQGRGSTVAGVWQGSQHRRKGKGYDAQEVVRVDPRSNYHPDNDRGVSTPEVSVSDARASIPRPNLAHEAAPNDHTRFLTGGK